MERGARLEEALAALLYQGDARARLARGDVEDPRFASLDVEELEQIASEVRQMVLSRSHRGTGGLRDWYPRTLGAWLAQHPEDASLDEVMAGFCASAHCAGWREGLGSEPGISLEEALYRFFEAEDIGDPLAREDELLASVVKSLAVTPEARFVWPAALRRAPKGCFGIGPSGTLFAALDGKYVTGPVTPLIQELLEGVDPTSESRIDDAAAPVRETLRGMGLL